MGSGVIIDGRGYILTNEHVVHNVHEITVKLPDGREFPGEVAGSDPRLDLAVIRIEGENLPVAKLGDSDKLRTGQWVMAIGNPFGFLLDHPQPTLTVGIISALNRSLSGTVLGQDRLYEGLIQTDAAINRGNSGGPLVNMRGEVIGINVAILAPGGGGGFVGIGFAIPVNIARRVISDLIEGKEVIHGWLGVLIQDLTPDLARKFAFPPGEKGVLLSKVLEDSPAGRADLRPGDIVMEVEGQKVGRAGELMKVISLTPVGERIRITIFREGRQKVLTAEVGARPTEPGERIIGPPLWRGIMVQELTEELAEELGFLEKEGVLISDVERESLAWKAGLRSGSIIMEVNRIKIKDLEAYQKAVAGIETEESVLIRTDKGYIVIPGEK